MVNGALNLFLNNSLTVPDPTQLMSRTPRKQENGGGFPRRFTSLPPLTELAEQLQHALLRLVGERQRRDRDRLAGRQRLAVGRFLVGVGQRQVRRTGLQNVDQVLVEVLTDLHDREVRTQGRRFRTQRGRRGVERSQRLVGRGVVQEVR